MRTLAENILYHLGISFNTSLIKDLFALEVRLAPATESQAQAAYDWADRLNPSRAYDGFYLADASEEGALFVTGDRRLANAAAKAGVSFVCWIGEGEN